MNDLLLQINEQLENFKKDSEAHAEKGNKAAAARARKASLNLTKLFKEYRQESLK